LKCFSSNKTYNSFPNRDTTTTTDRLQKMSSRITTTASSDNTAPRRFPDGVTRPADSKFCKVCFDAGLPVADYTDHFVKDQPGPNGKVICRTLLNQACRICQRTGHTSSYCPQYRRREEPRREEPRREEPRREEPRREDRYREDRYREEPRREDRYIEREPRREDRYREERYIEREPRREERYIEREPRREDRYIEREPRREEPRRGSFNQLRDDTEHREREIRERDDAYYREQEEQRRRDSTPWLQAVKKPYAHPHGPRVRLNLEAPALSAAKHGTANTDIGDKQEEFIVIRGHQHPLVIPGSIDVLAVNLSHSEQWGDEEVNTRFSPDEMCEEFLRNM
jgi:hypothetical protein